MDVLHQGALLNQIQSQLLASSALSNSSNIKGNQVNQVSRAIVTAVNALKAGIQDTAKAVQQTAGMFDQIYSALLASGNTELGALGVLEASVDSTNGTNSSNTTGSEQTAEGSEMRRGSQKQAADLSSLSQQMKGQANFSKSTGGEATLNGLWSGLGHHGYWHWKGKSGRIDSKTQEIIELMPENDITHSEKSINDVGLYGWQEEKDGGNKKREQQSENEEENELSLDKTEKADLRLLNQTLPNVLKKQADLNDQTKTENKAENELTLSAFSTSAFNVSSANNDFNQPGININKVQSRAPRRFNAPIPSTNVYEKVLYAFEMARDWQLKIVSALTDQMQGQTDFSKLLAAYEVYLNRMWSRLDNDDKKREGNWVWRDKDGKIDPKMQEIIDALRENGITIPEEGEGDMTIDKWLEKKAAEDENKEGQEGRLGKADLYLLMKTVSNASRRWADFSNQTQTKITQGLNLYSTAQEVMTNTISAWFRTMISIAKMISG